MELRANVIKEPSCYRIVARREWGDVEYIANSVDACVGKMFLHLQSLGDTLVEVNVYCE